MQNSSRSLVRLLGLVSRLPAAFSGLKEAEVYLLPLAGSCATSAAGAESFGRNAGCAFSRRYLMSCSAALDTHGGPHKQVWHEKLTI